MMGEQRHREKEHGTCRLTTAAQAALGGRDTRDQSGVKVSNSELCWACCTCLGEIEPRVVGNRVLVEQVEK